MTDNLNKAQKQQALFVQLIQQFYTSGQIYLGRLKNPQTDKIEHNLKLAQYFIDSLEMLEAKTKNNLAEAEQQLLSSILSELRIAYVEEINKKPSESLKESPPEESKEDEK